MRLSRRKPLRLVQPDPMPKLMAGIAQSAMRRQYASGVKDGMQIALELMLGKQSASGGIPYRGPLPDEARQWAEAALARVTEQRL